MSVGDLLPGGPTSAEAWADEAWLVRRCAALVQAFGVIQRERMVGVPALHPGLRIEAVGFAALPAAAANQSGTDALRGAAALGVLITPWFMNLVWLPLQPDMALEGVGRSRMLTLGGQRYSFLGGHEPALGAFSACSLFSPMFEFADHAAARATAQAVLDLLRPPVTGPATAEATTGLQGCPPAAPAAPTARGPARRAFLFGRGPAVART